MALNKLKYIFGQKSWMFKAYIEQLSRGKEIRNDDNKTLIEQYYTVSDCIVALGQLNYTSKLLSSNILWQVIPILSTKFHGKWAKLCFTLRKKKEQTLVTLLQLLEEWPSNAVLQIPNYLLPTRLFKETSHYSA